MPRGGVRQGAGRPTIAGEKAKPATFKIPPSLLEAIRQRAEAEGLNRTELLIKAIRAYLASK